MRDESAEDIRLILEPRSKNVDPDVLMDMMFRNSDLEVRFSLNMNVLIDGLTPKVCSMKEVLRAFLDFRREVLRAPLASPDGKDRPPAGSAGRLDRRLPEPRPGDRHHPLRRRPQSRADARGLGPRIDPRHVRGRLRAPAPGGDDGLTEVQTEAILNMRLRSLRKLEEMELLREQSALMEERAGLEDLLDSEALQWDSIADQLREVKKKFGKDYEYGARRTMFAEAGEVEDVPLEAMIDREPITVVCSQMGWIRAMTGHIDLDRELKFKDGDGPRFIFHAETTDRLLVFGSNGRFYTLSAANLPGGRGMGEPLRLMVDLPNEAEIVDLFIHEPGRKLLVASSAGDGFLVPEDDVLAQTRSWQTGAERQGRCARATVQTRLGRSRGLRRREPQSAGLWSGRTA